MLSLKIPLKTIPLAVAGTIERVSREPGVPTYIHTR